MSNNQPQPPEVDELEAKWQGLFDALEHDSDIVCAIVATAFLDHCLWMLLGKHFCGENTKVSILKPGGCLGEVMAKAKTAYCLGLISKGMLSNIQRLAEIRNQFAHKTDASSFTYPEVAAICNQLTVAHGATITGPPNAKLTDLVRFVHERGKMDTERGRFTATVGTICSAIHHKTRYLESCKPLTDKWDQKAP